MLIFFIHGVAEAKVKFAKPLQHLIKENFCQRGIKPPHFHAGFYADLFNKKCGYNSECNCQFRGYVGLIHAHKLRQEVKIIKQKYMKKC